MPRPTKGDLFDQARTYLDTDELNFPDGLLDLLCSRIWFQAVSMEREWRFFQQQGTVPFVAQTPLVPFTFTVSAAAVPGTRLQTVRLGQTALSWVEYTTGLNAFPNTGSPVAWSELNTGTSRNIRLFPTPSMDGTLTVDFYAAPVYPELFTATFADLPQEFDSALLEGLLSDMYFREEDPDLGDLHRTMFLEQMGSIRNRWRISLDTPMVMAGQARGPGRQSAGFDDMGRYTYPTPH